MRLLANWTDELISTTDIRLEFQRRRFAGARNYASNILKRLEKRGMVMRTGYGRYRIVRHHPHLVARRTGLWDAQGGEATARPRLRDLCGGRNVAITPARAPARAAPDRPPGRALRFRPRPVAARAPSNADPY